MQKTNSVNITKDFRHNFFVNVMDGAFFGFAIGFASFTTVIPLFVAQFTRSAILIGLIPAIHSMGWQLPQLFTARKVSATGYLRPTVILMTIQERLPFLGLGIIALFSTRIHPTLALVLIFILLIWQGMGAGLTANAWQNMIGKVIPSESRGTFFGTQSAAANLLASIGAAAAGVILQVNLFSAGFPICFFTACLLFIVSWFFLSWTREPRINIVKSDLPLAPLWKNVIHILKTDRRFLGFLISRSVYQIGMMASAFFVIYGVNELGITKASAGIMASVLMITAVLASLLFGWLADRWSHRSVFQIGAVASGLSAIMALYATNQYWLYGVMVLSAIGSAIFWTVGMSYTLEFGTDANRPTYVGTVNTLGAPFAVLAPLLGGWLADSTSYKVTFLVSSFAAVLTVFVIQFVSRSGKENTDEKK